MDELLKKSRTHYKLVMKTSHLISIWTVVTGTGVVLSSCTCTAGVLSGRTGTGVLSGCTGTDVTIVLRQTNCPRMFLSILW